MGKNKTPFAELISGIIPCTTGTVQVGEDIIDSDTLLKVRQEVALVRQNPQDLFYGLRKRRIGVYRRQFRISRF